MKNKIEKFIEEKEFTTLPPDIYCNQNQNVIKVYDVKELIHLIAEGFEVKKDTRSDLEKNTRRIICLTCDDEAKEELANQINKKVKELKEI